MLLNQLVTINQAALVANAVSFELMDDPDKNLRLCQGFVFNFDSDPKKLKTSTIGVLYAVRQSFHSPSEPNVHLMVQDYGKGKSHFALAIANFFQKPSNSPEVEGILQQIENSTSSDNYILENLKLYKQKGKNLVICLSGDKPIDLKKHFLQALRKALESEGITESIGQKVCQAPLEYLENLNAKQRQEAEAYLKEQENPEGDLDTIIELLREDNYQVISRVKEISRQLTGAGLPLDFDVDIDVEEILNDIINKLCTGENRRFQGVLILFDELYNYLQLWANDPVRAGSTTLQNITNICEKYKGKIAILSFSQRSPKKVTPSKHLEDYNRLVSRLELLPTTYEPAASLELVLNNLLLQQGSAWQQFYHKWRDTLTALNTEIYQNRTANYYQNRNWLPEKFFTQITEGCFPLHPLTAYLLCNLDFTQGRTAIQFVQTDVAEFIQEQPFEKNNHINFIYPVTLVDAFADNFKTSDSSAYSAYRHAYDSIVACADIAEMTVLKALFLYYASVSVGKLTKRNSEEHEKLLSLLTGMSEAQLKAILEKLSKEREVIYYNPAAHAYRFYSGGFRIQDLRKRIEEEVGHKKPALSRVQKYCQENLQLFGANIHVSPTQFIEQNKLNSNDWLFKCEVYTPAGLRKALSNQQSQTNEIGIVAYVVAETSEELASLKSEMSQLLVPSANDLTSIKRKIAVAVASQPAEEIARLLLMWEYAKEKSVQEFGAALTQLQNQLEEQIKNKTKELFNSCTYYCHILDKVPVGNRTKPFYFASILLQDLYPLVAPQEKNDKLALKSTKGGEIIGYVCKRLLEDDLCQKAFNQQAYKNLIEPVFQKSWRLLKLDSGSKYSVQVPIQSNVKAAWDKISDLTALGNELEKNIDIAKIWETLANPPYGYNEYTFTILFTGWLAYHRSEVALQGGFGIPLRNSEEVKIVIKPVKDWASTNIFDKPKDFVQKWILNNSKPRLIRRQPITCPEVPNSVNFDEAQQFIQEINDYLSNDPDPVKVKEITKIKDKLSAGIESINQRLAPVLQAKTLLQLSNDAVDIEQLLPICTSLYEEFTGIFEIDLSIIPTSHQQVERQEVLQLTIEKVGKIITEKIQQVQLSRTVADCTEVQADLNQTINLIQQANYLPDRFIEELKNAKKAATAKSAEITEQSKVDNCLAEIQKVYNSLSSLATQAEYIEVKTQIKNQAATVPAAREKDIYKNIIQDLEVKQETLNQKISDWEHQFSQSMSRHSAMQLSKSINKEINRFTDEESQQRLHNLLDCVEDIILQRKTEEQESEDIYGIIADAETKVQQAKNANLSEAFTAYHNLNQFRLPTLIKNAAFKNKPKELENFKSQGYDAILQRLTQLLEKCKQPMNENSDYEQLKTSLQKSKEFVTTCDDFRSLNTELQEAEETLQTQYEEFQKQQQDKQKLHSLRQYTVSKANTIHLCEDAITNINALKNDFYDRDKYISEVEKLIQEFFKKVTTFKNQLHTLQERLVKVKNLKEIDSIKKEYAQLDFVFKDSTEYPIYQQLQAEIDSLAADLECLRHWESLYQQSNSIASCDRTLTTIDNEQASLHNLERFKEQVEQLQTNLRQRTQGYVCQLNELYSKLSNIKTQKEAQKLQGEITSKSSYYRESQEEERYELICSEVNSVLSLLQISENQKVDTVQACQAEKERLLKWRSEVGEITATVLTRFDLLVAQLDQTQLQIENQQRDAAIKWLEGLETQSQQLQSTEAAKKLDKANQLLKQIRQQEYEYERILQAEQQQILKRIINIGKEIQNQDKESQIITLFQQLPHEQRENLLKKLPQYLLGTTEEF